MTFPSVPRCPSLHGSFSLAVLSSRGHRWSGLGLTRASGGSRFGVLSVPLSRSWVPARDGTDVCGSPTWWHVHCPGTGLRCFCNSTCYSVLFNGPCCLVVWVVHSGEGSSQDCPLSLLAEVLPRSALCLFRATVELPLRFEVFRLVGLHSGEVLPGWLLALLVEVLPKAALCCFGCRYSLSLCRDELSFLLGRCRSKCRAPSYASGCYVGQLVSLVISKFLGYAGGIACPRGSDGRPVGGVRVNPPIHSRDHWVK
ncbi:hypothetical protein Taro_034026, partial [Colocasia esculenta]|nr:hypothetical protein [Colocasia esculenta]